MTRQDVLMALGAAAAGMLLGYLSGGLGRAVLLGVASAIWSVAYRQLRTR